MAQKINIAELDIDIEALTKKASDVRVNLIETGKKIDQLKKDFKDGTISVSEYAQRLTTLNAVQKENQKELRVYDTMLQANLSTETKKMKQNEVLTGSIRELSAALSQNKQIYQNLTEEERNNAEIGGKLLKTIQEQDKKYKELQKSIGNTQVEVGNYKEEVKKALAESYGFEAQVNKLTDSLGAFKDVGISIVNTLKDFTIGNQEAIDKLKQNTNETQKAAKAQVLWTNATKGTSLGLKILRGALLATGIGAVVVVLSSLISYLTSTQEGINKVNSVLTPLKTVLATLFGVVQNVGKALFEAFKNPKQVLIDFGNLIKDQIINRLTAGIEVAKGFYKVFTGEFKEGFKQVGNGALQAVTGVENVIDKSTNGIKNLSNTINEAWERGKRIEEITQQLSKSEADFIEKTASLKQQFKEQNKIAEDTTKTFKEREEATRKSIEIQKQINDLAKDRNSLEQELLDLKFASNDTSDANRVELANKRKEIAEANAQMEEAVTTQNNKLNTIRKSASDEAKKRIEADLAEQKKQIDFYVATNSAIAQSLQERLNIEEKAKNDRLAILEKEKNIGKISKEEYEREKYSIETEYLKTRAELSIEATQREVEQYETLNKSKIDKETELTAEIIAEELLRIQTIYNNKVQAIEEEKRLKQDARDWDYNAEAEYQANLLSLKQSFDEEYQETTKNLNETFEAQERERVKAQQALDFEEKLASLQAQNAMSWEIETEMLKQKHIQEDQALQEQHQKGLIDHDTYLRRQQVLNQKQAQEDKELKQKTEEAKLQLTLGALSQAKGLFEEHTAVGKAAAIAEATINTYLGVTKALSAYPPPYSTIMAGVTLAMGFKNIQKIVDTKSKYQKGGLVHGRSHAEGGVPFTVQGQEGYEMEGDEYIVNKKATIQYFPLLEMLNKSDNTSFKRSNYFKHGGLVSGTTNPVSKIDMSQIADAVREGAMMGAFEGARQGSEQGTFEGAKQGSYEGATQGTYEGATIGTSTGIYQGSVKYNDISETMKTSMI